MNSHAIVFATCSITEKVTGWIKCLHYINRSKLGVHIDSNQINEFRGQGLCGNHLIIPQTRHGTVTDMEQVQYTSSEHNAADISDTSDNSNNNTIVDSSTPNGNSSMRIISSMMQYRKQSGSNGSMEADAYIDKSRNELKLLRCNAFHRSRVSIYLAITMHSRPTNDNY